MKELIKKMKNTDTWYREDISKVLADNNPKIGDEQFFNQAIYQAQEAKLIEPISIPKQTSSFFYPGADPKTYNYQYKPEAIVYWLKEKKWKCPQLLNNTIPKKNPEKKEKAVAEISEENALNNSAYWNSLKKLSLQAISKYPEWKKLNKKKIQQSDITNWLIGSLQADTREAEIIKKILSETFE